MKSINVMSKIDTPKTANDKSRIAVQVSNFCRTTRRQNPVFFRASFWRLFLRNQKSLFAHARLDSSLKKRQKTDCFSFTPSLPHTNIITRGKSIQAVVATFVPLPEQRKLCLTYSRHAHHSMLKKHLISNYLSFSSCRMPTLELTF